MKSPSVHAVNSPFLASQGDHVNAWHATEVLHAAAKVEALVVPLSGAQGIPSGTKEGRGRAVGKEHGDGSKTGQGLEISWNLQVFFKVIFPDKPVVFSLSHLVNAWKKTVRWMEYPRLN